MTVVANCKYSNNLSSSRVPRPGVEPAPLASQTSVLPLGHLLPCSHFKCRELLELLRSELDLDYLNDVAMVDTASFVLREFIGLEDTASQLGLEIEHSQGELIGHDEVQNL